VKKQLSDNYLLIAYIVAIVLWVMVCAYGCSPESAPVETERLRSHQAQYKAALIGSQVVFYRAADGGKFTVIGSQVSGMNTVDTVWTQTKTTTEKY